MIPLVLNAAINNEKPIHIFGDDYNTKDGTCIRDYIHVTDLAMAHVNALEYLEKFQQSDVFNLGNGEGFSVLDVIHVARQVTGIEIPYKVAPRRPGDPPLLISRADKARRLMRWEPQYTQLKDQIQHAWNWMTKNK